MQTEDIVQAAGNSRQLASSPSISVIIPCSRPQALARCLRSLSQLRGAQPDEIILVLAENTAECRQVASTELRDFPRSLRLLPLDGAKPGVARNAAIALASGDWLCFFDDDVVIHPDYFAALKSAQRRHPSACAIGGPNLTPNGSGLFERCSGYMLASWLGSGPFARRYRGYHNDSWCDDAGLILCNLNVNKNVLAREGLRFDPTLLRNEENLLLSRLFARGHRALHCPALRVEHERRSGAKAFARQCFLSGQGRALMTRKRPGSARLYHAMPLILLATLLGALIGSSTFKAAALAYFAVTLSYSAYIVARENEPLRAFACLWLHYPLGHLSYAAGLISGVVAVRSS